MAKNETATVHLTIDAERFREDLEALANEIFADAEARAEAMVRKIAADLLDEKVREIVRDEMAEDRRR